ncbi:hypothetical protein, partial [Klebsiella pneumoniae]|uniref:hypothetical protein n=1 Tax=Klebsiella pneumoniae TaxID=573 RepID=UPI003CCB079A
MAETSRRLGELPPVGLALDADQVSAGLAQHAAARALRQQLAALHGQLQPLSQRLSQLHAAGL